MQPFASSFLNAIERAENREELRRDLVGKMQQNRGHSVYDREQMLRECGFAAANSGIFESVDISDLR